MSALFWPSLADDEIEDQNIEPDPGMELENTIALGPRCSTEFDSEVLGPPSGYTCPDCNGSLLAVGEKNFRCRVGHAWSADHLLAARRYEVEGALWVALRSLHEKAKLSRRLAEDSGSSPMAQPVHTNWRTRPNTRSRYSTDG